MAPTPTRASGSEIIDVINAVVAIRELGCAGAFIPFVFRCLESVAITGAGYQTSATGGSGASFAELLAESGQLAFIAEGGHIEPGTAADSSVAPGRSRNVSIVDSPVSGSCVSMFSSGHRAMRSVNAGGIDSVG
jgi:hypothetical protein